ncbi:hypothetical protein CcrRB23_gp414 [Caulobacter phage RB23]|nr:hypothetical protein CcrRB23_gp414 [Caulobacter phage RB23]
MTTDQSRLLKYRRKKAVAFRSGNAKLSKYLTLYWRYHWKVYGPPIHLWGTPVAAPQKGAKR